MINYPKNPVENIRFRASMLNECEKDHVFANKMRHLAKNDILFFFNVGLWAEDPFADKGLRHGVERIRYRPLVTYPFQDEFITDLSDAIEKGEDLVCDKSRDMLATYMVLGVYLHGWVFKGHKYLITSWNEDEVDGRDDTSTLFGKIRFNLRRLPFWLQPEDFKLEKNSSYMRLTNPSNGGTIVGTAKSGAIGSGRREDSVMFDEFSKWQGFDEEAWISASDTTKCKVAIWTPRGSANKAAQLIRGDTVKRKHHLFWYLHPEKCFTSSQHMERVKRGEVYDKAGKRVVELMKDQSKSPSGCYLDEMGKVRSEWYDRECDTREENDILENLDCNYLTTGNPVFDTEKCNLRRMQCKEPLAYGNLVWNTRPIFDTFGTCTNKRQLSVEFIKNPNGIYKLWEYPERDWENGYSVSADVAEGLEQGDFDSATGIRRFPKQGQSLLEHKPTVVITLRCHLKTFEYAEELAKMGVYLNYAWVAPERTGLGLSVVDQLWKFYDKIFHKQILSKGYPEQTDKLGWDTNNQSKGHIITNLSKMISEESFVDNDEGFWDETLTFVNDNGKLEAQGKGSGSRCYDDRVMDRAIGFWVDRELPTPVYRPRVVVKKSWRNAVDVKENSLVGGFILH